MSCLREIGTDTTEVCRGMDVSEQTLYRWKHRFADTGVTGLRGLHRLENERHKLKQLVADLTLRESIRKSPEAGSEARARRFSDDGFGISERRACHPALLTRASYRYKSTVRDQTALQLLIQEGAAARVRCGYVRIHVLQKRLDSQPLVQERAQAHG